MSPSPHPEPSPIQELVCCMGLPVAGNPTQFMIERAFGAAGLDWRYLTLEVTPENLADAVRGLRAMGFRGANFTAPHKAAAVAHLDELSEAAELIGAVNCALRAGEKLVGENTEGTAFVQALQPLVSPEGSKVVLLGAGGAARAIAVELARHRAAEIVVVNRLAERGQSLVDLLRNRLQCAARLVHLSGTYAPEDDAQIVINATAIGAGDPEAVVPLDLAPLGSSAVVADVVFNPSRTRLIREAQTLGCQTLDGLAMMVNQAAIGFKLWTDVEPDRGVMREALEEYLEI